MAVNDERLFPYSLLGIALQKSADEFLFIDTIDKAGVWFIDIIGYQKPAYVSTDMLGTACSNYEQWIVGSLWSADEDPTARLKPGLSTAKLPFKNGKVRKAFEDYGAEGHGKCYADAYDAGGKGLFLSINIIDRGTAPAPDALEREVTRGTDRPSGPGTPLWYVYSPIRKLRELATP